jgi:LysM repeat protein
MRPGDLVIDYSFARPSLEEAKASGARAVIRYSAGAASDASHPSHSANAGKLISPAEFKQILAAGLDVIAVDEWYESRVTEGYSAGVQDGRAAAALWRSCGLAKGATVYCAWDAAPTGSFFRVRRYLRGWTTGAGQEYRADLYAGTPVLRRLSGGMPGMYRIRYGWRPSADSWSDDGLPFQPSTRTDPERAALVARAVNATPAHLWQTGNTWFGGEADEDLVVRVPVGSHRETLGEPQPKPVHHVQPGDTFASIAKQWGVSVEALMAANPRTPTARLDIIRHP